MKVILVSILLAAALSAAPSTYNILKLPPGATLTMNGTMNAGTEWSETYFIDSMRNNNNCFDESNPPWTPANIQYKVYAAWDSNRVYFAVKIMSDQTIIGPTTQCMEDNIKISSGGKGAPFYITIDGGKMFNGSCPFTNTMVGGCNPTGNGSLPSYEFSLNKSILDSNGTGSFKLCIGTEDEDDIVCGAETYCAIGVEYMGPKNFSSAQSPSDNSNYYPTFNLFPESIAERKSGDGRASIFTFEGARPNPFNPTTRIGFVVHGTNRLMDRKSISLDLYNVNGEHVRMLASGPMEPGYHSVLFDGRSDKGQALSSGVYYCKMRAEGFEATKVILMMK